MPRHLDEEGKENQREQALAQGLVTLDDLYGHEHSDRLAKEAAAQHDSVTLYARTASDANAVTVAAQRM